VGGLVATLGETGGNSPPVVALLVVVLVNDRAGVRREHRLAIMLAVIPLTADWLSALPAVR
jgi:hypothetical protein